MSLHLRTDNIYQNWQQIAQQIVDEKQTEWKTQPFVNYMLEHVWFELGQQHLQHIDLDTTEIQRLCSLNDQFGDKHIREEMINFYVHLQAFVT